MKNQAKWTPYLFLCPTLLLFLVIFMIPIGFVLYSSVFDWNLQKPHEGRVFIGLGNFVDLLTDKKVWAALWVTAKFVILAVPVELLLGLLIALLLNRSFMGKRWVQGIILTPLMVSPVAIYLSWKFLLEPTFGIVNYLLGKIGVGPYGWFSDVNMALLSVVLVDIWQNTAFVFLVFYAALQTVPREPVESAQVDGANRFHVFWYVTLPAIKPAALVLAIIRVMDAIRAFDNIYVLTLGGPANATRTIQFLDYELAFKTLEVGQGSALGLIIVVVILLVGSLLIREMNRTNEELK